MACIVNTARYDGRKYSGIYDEYRIWLEYEDKENKSMTIEYDNINNVINMLNSNQKEDIMLALGIIDELDSSTLEYGILIHRLVNTSNWVLITDYNKKFYLKRIVYRKT